jgi:tripartite-type tricarboxylate transporter receptor subunit TctC
MQTMRHLAAALCASMLALCSASASAQDASAWPDRPIKLVLPTAPGGALDSFTRQMAEKLAVFIKQPVIVDNRPGANGMIAATAVARAPADGYTVLVSLSSLVQTPLLNAKVSYKVEELAPVSLTAYLPNGFAVGATVPVTTLAGFIDYAKANRGKLSYGSSGSGSSGHIMGEALKRNAQIDMVHAPFKGESPAILAVLGGDITAAFGAPGTQAEYAKAGKVRLLAVAAPRRLRDFPNVATFTELGFPNVDLPGWSGVLMPAGTPKAILDRFAAEWVRVVQQPDIASRIFGFGFEPVGSTPEVFRQFIKTENDKWSAAIKGSNITLE